METVEELQAEQERIAAEIQLRRNIINAANNRRNAQRLQGEQLATRKLQADEAFTLWITAQDELDAIANGNNPDNEQIQRATDALEYRLTDYQRRKALAAEAEERYDATYPAATARAENLQQPLPQALPPPRPQKIRDPPAKLPKFPATTATKDEILIWAEDTQTMVRTHQATAQELPAWLETTVNHRQFSRASAEAAASTDCKNISRFLTKVLDTHFGNDLNGTLNRELQNMRMSPEEPVAVHHAKFDRLIAYFETSMSTKDKIKLYVNTLTPDLKIGLGPKLGGITSILDAQMEAEELDVFYFPVRATQHVVAPTAARRFEPKRYSIPSEARTGPAAAHATSNKNCKIQGPGQSDTECREQNGTSAATNPRLPVCAHCKALKTANPDKFISFKHPEEACFHKYPHLRPAPVSMKTMSVEIQDEDFYTEAEDQFEFWAND
ncbi:hypothetical protein BDR26DRAFT_929937 [Obelidium mucronatum]|nr:hypothetical protein BDR26DRAFT_929937 [Obelidium mucronatum]